MKDQIYFMQTDTPQYKVNKQAGLAASTVGGNSFSYPNGLSVSECLTTLVFVYFEKKKKTFLRRQKCTLVLSQGYQIF